MYVSESENENRQGKEKKGKELSVLRTPRRAVLCFLVAAFLIDGLIPGAHGCLRTFLRVAVLKPATARSLRQALVITWRACFTYDFVDRLEVLEMYALVAVRVVAVFSAPAPLPCWAGRRQVRTQIILEHREACGVVRHQDFDA